MGKTVIIENIGAVRILTLNRPHRLNAINSELLGDLRNSLDGALGDTSVNVIVLRGAGRSFCSGDDLKEFSSQSKSESDSRTFIENIQDITRRIVMGDKVVVCAVHGWAVGGGLEWVINADLAVFAEDAKCFFPEIRWGMFPTGGVTWLLPKQVGLSKTRELIFLGEEFSAEQALEMGLAWRVVAEKSVFATALEAAQKIASMPQLAVQNLKRAFNGYPDYAELNRAMDFETEATVQGFLDPATKKLVSKFRN